ncbi:hypothetical protein HYFRA_00011728 [Hymenoscyphus fraxineus]|uniref:Chitin-binding type-4 domain-containing protein n=1 Tax=Hymenoscyphus fraxineus TaxID=746836 RepID=A0A9N9PXE3_9HELO|nr:hypothetical protein HYFRA_00011728 [Hymenoscyphus fraxineus]
MQYSSFVLAAAAGLITNVAGHGFLSSPPPRLAGDAMKAVCGNQVFSNQASDNGGNIQGMLQVAKSQKDFDPVKCNVFLCKGFQFADNQKNIQTFTAGQVVPYKFDIRAPHTGTANISVVDTATNSVIGEPLLTFDNFADNSKTASEDQKSGTFTIPTGLESKCGTAGNCVIQHFWDARSIDQTYESCIDFQMGGGGGGAAAPAPAVTPAAAVPAGNTPAKAVPTTLATVKKAAATPAPQSDCT